MSAKKLIDEIKASHYTNVGKKKRTPKVQATEAVPVVEPTKPSANQSFKIEIVGGIGLPGYPLKEGEKLAIVKLSPIAIK